MNALLTGASVAFRRLSDAWAIGALGAALTAVGVIASLERGATPLRAADYTLAGVVFGWALPLLGLAVVARASSHGGLDDAVLAIGRHGGSRRSAAFGIVLVTAATVAAAGALLAIFGVLVARARLDFPALQDALTSAWIAALGGAVYAGWFSLGSVAWRGSRGAAVFLAVDWILGGGHGAVAAAWPRAHLRSLLGAEPVLGLAPWQSTAALYALGGFYVSLALARVAK